MPYSAWWSLNIIEVFVMVPVVWTQKVLLFLTHCKAIPVVENINWIDLHVFIVL